LAGTPIATHNVNGGYFSTELEANLYEENRNLQGVLNKLTQFLAAHHSSVSFKNIFTNENILKSLVDDKNLK